MPIPQELELLSQQLDILLGREYQALSKAFHALQTEDGHPVLPLAFNAAPQVSVSSNHIEAVMDEMPVAQGDGANKAGLGLSR